MIDINKNIKSLGDAHVLIDGITETKKNRMKKQEAFSLLC